MRLIAKEKYVLRFDFLIWSLKIWIWMSVFWLCYFFGHSIFLLLCTKPTSPVQTTWGNFLNFSSGLEETLMMRLITKEKYVLRFDFLIWSLKIWIWMSVFWLCYFFGHSIFLLLCTKPTSPVKTTWGNFLNFSSGLEETLMMRLITKEKYVLRFDFLIWSLKVWIWAFLILISW